MIFSLILILTSPLSDHAKVAASNQYALPVLTYLMWTQTWPIANIQQLDQVGRKIVVENGGKHPRDRQRYSTCQSRKLGGRGLKSVDREWIQESVIERLLASRLQRTASVRFKLRNSQNKKWADKKQFLWIELAWIYRFSSSHIEQ